jgi:hypothetical protein
MAQSVFTTRTRTVAHPLWLIPWMAAVTWLCSCNSVSAPQGEIRSAISGVNPDQACTSCLEAPIQWGWSGGLTRGTTQSGVDPCRTYHHKRTVYNHPEDAAACSAPLPCNASSTGIRRLRALVGHPDVQRALASGPDMKIFGCDERAVDAPLFVVETNDGSFGVGSGCLGCSRPCERPPAAIEELVGFLRELDDRMVETEPCKSALGSR